MKERNVLLDAVLIIALIACIIMTWSMYRNLKKQELAFKEKKALMIKQSLDLKDEVTSLRETITEKNDAIASLQKNLADLERIKEENEKTIATFAEQLKAMHRQTTLLSRQVPSVITAPTGRMVELPPIVITKRAVPAGLAIPGKAGKVLSVDKRHALIVANLGRRNRIKEGDLYVIAKGGEEIGTAEVISVRYRVSAAVIEGTNPGYSINDISEGHDVLLLE